MRKITLLLMALLAISVVAKPKAKKTVETWPDGSAMDAWFQNTQKVDVTTLGRQYVITDYGVLIGSSELQTQKIQTVIDRAASEGGGVVVIPQGTFMTGALFFKQGTHLHVAEGATLKGSDRIMDYPILQTRIEGETCKYFSALINADGLDGFTISGKGTIDGNGLHSRSYVQYRRLSPQARYAPACCSGCYAEWLCTYHGLSYPSDTY